MCDVLDKVEKRGFVKGKTEGKAEGIAKMSLLFKSLFDQNRIEDVKRASEDESYRSQLMKEFGID